MTKMEKMQMMGMRAEKAKDRVEALYRREKAMGEKIAEMERELARLRFRRGKASEAAYDADEKHRQAMIAHAEETLNDFNYVGSKHHY